jgi:F-type H+-transporting ATPase subunit delta
MADPITVARPYAEAVFRTAVEARALDAYAEALDRLAVVTADATMAELLSNPRHSLHTKLGALEGVAGDLPPPLKALLSMLVDSRRSSLLVPIRDHFHKLKRAHESVLKVVIASAFPLAESERDDLVQALARKYGKRIEATVEVDPALLGGVRIQVGDMVVSASVRDQLNQMAVALSA